MNALVLWGHLVATLYLTGLIWVIQIVHYPLMDRVPGENFVEFHHQHARRIGIVVVAPMIVELVTAGVLAISAPSGVPAFLPATGLALVAVIWLSTFVLLVPLHSRLSGGFDAAAHAALVSGNWIRTIAWSLRAAIAVAITVTATG